MHNAYDLRVDPDDLIRLLLTAHKEESDEAAKPLIDLLIDYGRVQQSSGKTGLDYVALVEFDGDTFLVEDNNAWARVYDPSDASYDVEAALAGKIEA